MANKIKIQWSKFSLTYSWECNRLAMHIIAPLSTLKSNLFAIKQFGRPSGILFCLSMALRSSILRWQICPLQCLWGTFLKRKKKTFNYDFLNSTFENWSTYIKKFLTNKNLDDPIKWFADKILMDGPNFSLFLIVSHDMLLNLS